MINRIKKIYKNNQGVVNNLGYLSLFNFFSLLSPLVAYPYLIRVLGADVFGKVIFAQSIVIFFSIVIDYGFNLTATKEVSIHRKSKSKLSEIVSSVLIIKLVLWVSGVLLLILLLNVFTFMQDEKALYLFSYSVTFTSLLFPQFFFQGIEKMKFITIVNITTRVLFLILIFIFIKNKEDYIFVPLLMGTGMLVGGIISLYFLFKTFNLNFIIPNINTLKNYLFESTPIFGSNIIIALKDKLNIVFIGIFLTTADVTVYDLAIRILTLFNLPITIVNNSIYPKVSKTKDKRYVINVIIWLAGIIFVAILFVQPFYKEVVNFLADGLNKKAILGLRIILLSSVILSISNTIAINGLVAFGYNKLFFEGMLVTTLFYFLLVLLGYQFKFLNSVLVFIIITVSVYFFELLYRIFLLKRIKAKKS